MHLCVCRSTSRNQKRALDPSEPERQVFAGMSSLLHGPQDPRWVPHDSLTSNPLLHLQDKVFNKHPKVSLTRLVTLAILGT